MSEFVAGIVGGALVGLLSRWQWWEWQFWLVALPTGGLSGLGAARLVVLCGWGR